MNEDIVGSAGDEEMDLEFYYEQKNDDQIENLKYSKLLRKCEQIKMENFRLINYIDQINKLVRKVRKQNAFICNKLDLNNDDYHKFKPSILKEIEVVIDYGKSKLDPNPKLSNSLNEERDYDLSISHRNKRIKIENKIGSTGNLSKNQTDNLANILTS